MCVLHNSVIFIDFLKIIIPLSPPHAILTTQKRSLKEKTLAQYAKKHKDQRWVGFYLTLK